LNLTLVVKLGVHHSNLRLHILVHGVKTLVELNGIGLNEFIDVSMSAIDGIFQIFGCGVCRGWFGRHDEQDESTK
jgi:hypothetical protein